jgi:uncharacterized protein YndB with AHSA1/START domain
MDTKPAYVYVTYIHATPERVWEALTDADLPAQFWGHSNVSDWEPGSPWRHVRTDGSGIADVVGTVSEAVPGQRLVMTFASPSADDDADASLVTFTIEPHEDIVRLTVVHEGLDPDDCEAASMGWQM